MLSARPWQFSSISILEMKIAFAASDVQFVCLLHSHFVCIDDDDDDDGGAVERVQNSFGQRYTYGKVGLI